MQKKIKTIVNIEIKNAAPFPYFIDSFLSLVKQPISKL